MIPRETVQQILDTARIEDVVSDFVALKRRGASFVACCPFHNEKTPSFYVTPSKGIFKCFGCGKSGTAVGFVMEHEHASYAEALRYLARKYHIEVKEEEESAEEIARRQHSESLLLVSEWAQKFFAEQLRDGEGRAVGYAYFRSRALTEETIAKFGLGWAPSSRTALLDAARQAGYKEEYLLEAGLLRQKEEGGPLVDKFVERVTFPIHSLSGRVIAFSCRTLRSDNPAKYVNSPETEIYKKSRVLYGLYQAKSEIARRDECILVEGNIDMVMMHQKGITNVVATCGTALTVEQIRLVRKFTENMTIMYDGDSAGIKAAIRGLDLVLAEGMNVHIVLLPEGEDPDSFCRGREREEVEDYIRGHATDFISFKTDLLLAEAAGDPLRKANLINDIADTIARIPDAIKRSVYVESVAMRFDIDRDILFERITKTLRAEAERPRNVQPQTVAAEPPRTEEVLPPLENVTLAKAESDLLYFLLTHGCDTLAFPADSEFSSPEGEENPTVADFIRNALESDGSQFANSAYRRLYDAYMALYDQGLAQDVILRTLLDGEDRVGALLAAQLSTEKYRLSVKVFEEAMTTPASWLVIFVPRAILYYAERRVHYSIDCLRRSLEGAPAEEQLKILEKIVKLQGAQRKINKKLGRE